MGKGKKAKKATKPVKDDRFAKVHQDPRFRVQASKDRKVEIDDRFKAMLTDPKFSTHGMSLT